jgi:hypothetical protein
MSQATDTVEALTELAAYLHTMSRKAFHLEAREAYADAATRVDQIIIGPAMGSMLQEMDEERPEPFRIEDTCCGKCPGGTCYVDQVTGA